MTEDENDFFLPENALLEKRTTKLSPCGRYSLRVTPYKTRPGFSYFTLGEVFRAQDLEQTEKICEIRRNYPDLWSFFLSDHPLTGHDYLLTGEDYQGFSLVNLTTGVKRSFRNPGADQGFGWCPISAKIIQGFRENRVTLSVDGCYWAGPYEQRIYDFSDPDAESFEKGGLPYLSHRIEIDCDYESRSSQFNPGELVCIEIARRFVPTGEWESSIREKLGEFHRLPHLLRKTGGDPEEIKRAEREMNEAYAAYFNSSKDSLWERVPLKETTYILDEEGFFLEDPVREWKSEHLLQLEREEEEAEKETQRIFQEHIAKDPFCIYLREEFPKAEFLRRKQAKIQEWEGDDNSFYVHLQVSEREASDKTASLEWGAEKGSVIAELWRKGVNPKKFEFERSLLGLQGALQRAREFLAGRFAI